MFANNYVLAVFAVISVSAYCINAWNNTSFPVLLTKCLAKLGLIKKQNSAALSEVYTRDDWQLWSTSLLPDWAVAWLNCHICQTPYVASFFSWLILYKLGNFSVSYSALGWCISLILIIKLQNTQPAIKPAKTITTPVFANSNPKPPKNPFVINKELQLPVLASKPVITEPFNTGNNEVFSAAELTQIHGKSKEVMVTKIAEAKENSQNKIQEASAKYDLWKKEMGIQTEEGPKGEKIVTAFNPILVEALKFFRLEEPCFFEGCDSLRAEYTKELEAKGTECPACAKSELQRKYMITIKRAIEAHKSRTQ